MFTIGVALLILTHNVFALTDLEQFFLENNIPLNTPITVYDVNDEIPIGMLSLWQEYTKNEAQNTG